MFILGDTYHRTVIEFWVISQILMAGTTHLNNFHHEPTCLGSAKWTSIDTRYLAFHESDPTNKIKHAERIFHTGKTHEHFQVACDIHYSNTM